MDLLGIDSPVSFSPDSSEMVFLLVRQDSESITVANQDGGSARTIIKRNRPNLLSHDGTPSWSPDGRFIAFAAGTHLPKRELDVFLYDLASGSETKLTRKSWFNIKQTGWLLDGSGIVMTAANEGETNEQIYQVAYPTGETKRLTNDLYDYSGISIGRKEKQLVTIAAEESAQIYTLDLTDGIGAMNSARQISTVAHDWQGVAWTQDDRIVFGSTSATGYLDIWIMNADGGNRRHLLNDQAADTDPAVSGDNRYIVFVSRRAGTHNLWRINTDGSNLIQLTNGTGEFSPQISPDNRWVVYHRLSPGDPISVWKVPIEGGAPQQLSNKPTSRPDVSPDNLLVSSTYREETDSPLLIGVYPLEGIGKVKVLKPMPEARLFVPMHWSPDGKSIVYVVSKDGADNLWSQKLAASIKPKQLTNFTTDKVYGFDFSFDGKQLAISRGRTNSYIVSIMW